MQDKKSGHKSERGRDLRFSADVESDFFDISRIRDTSVKDVVTFSTTFHPGFFDDLALLFVL